MMRTAFIGFGANLGHRRSTYEEAVLALSELSGSSVTRTSRLYETEPMGLSDGGPPFVNAVIALETDLDAVRLMEELQNIEKQLGKSPDHRSDLSRAIDLDLLLLGTEHITESGLEVPHPRMSDRAFVLVPLAEIAPDAIHPVLMETVESLLRKLPRDVLDGVNALP